jgi:CelD/BcsL family acetyltransferase involved in cellulose biosynthesis
LAKREGFGVNLQVVRLHSLEQADPYWRALFQFDHNATFFSSPAWLKTWWVHNAAGRDPLLFVMKVPGEDQPAGLALLQSERVPAVGIRSITFLGSGLADYGDILVNEAVATRRDVLWALLNELVISFPNSLFDFQQIPETSPTLALLQEWIGTKGLSSTTLIQDVCPTICLPSQPEQYHQQLKKSFLADLRRGERRLREKGNVVLVDQVRPTDGDWLQLKDQLAGLQAQRMRTKGEVPLWQGPLGQFVADMLQASDKENSLLLTGLYLNDQLIAYELCFLHHETIYAWSRAFDEAYRNSGPGKIALLHLLETGIQKGYRLFDLLRGEEPYKELWTNSQIKNSRVVFVVRPSPTVLLWYKYVTSWRPRLTQVGYLKKLNRVIKSLRGR